MAAPREAPAIGIDLGTTFSLGAIHRNNKTDIITDNGGRRLIPSCVFYSHNDDTVLVGQLADDQFTEDERNFENIASDIKRIMGRKFDDAYVQELIRDKRYRFKIVQGPDDKAAIEMNHNGLKVVKLPEEVCSEILKHIKDNARTRLGVEVTEAVISVPARFSNSQRMATKKAGELAGFKVLKLISEPVAAAIHYSEDMQPDGVLLVVDLGGGTLDVTVVEVNDKKFSVKSVEGDTFLGGQDFDQLLFNYVKEDLENAYQITDIPERILHRIYKRVTKAKCKLSEAVQCSINMPIFRDHDIIEYTIQIRRQEFEALMDDLITKIVNLIKECVAEAGLITEDISNIVLVGGSTRIPQLQKAIRDHFQKEPKLTVNPDEAVALGAALQAAVLKREHISYEKYQITEVTPMFLGLAVRGNLLKVAIPKNTRIPFTSKAIRTVTRKNNQTRVNEKVYEGQRKNCHHNNLLGAFHIENLPKRRAGDVKLETVFKLNENGILDVEAWETSTGTKNKLVVTVGAFGLCDYKVQHKTEEASKARDEDDRFHIYAKYMARVEKISEHFIHEINQVSFSSVTIQAKEIYNQITKIINDPSPDYEESVIRQGYKIFYNDAAPLVKMFSLRVDLKSDKDIYQEVLKTVDKYNEKFYKQDIGETVLRN